MFNIYGENKGTGFAGNVYNPDGIAPTLRSASGGNQQPLIVEENKQLKFKFDEPMAYDEQNKYIRKDGCVGTLTTDGSSPKHNNRVITRDLRIRKLTPKECFRLMGFSDCDIDILIDNGISNTQLYKMAGNSIVVDVLEEIFVELLNQYENVFPVGG